MLTTTYLLNRRPTKKLKNITLGESWSRFKPSMSHLKAFGLVAYRYVPDQLRKKLDDKVKQMIRFGYHSTSGYKPYEAVKKRIIISRDMIFAKLRDWQHIIIIYQLVFWGPKTSAGEVQIEENMRKSTIKRCMPVRL